MSSFPRLEDDPAARFRAAWAYFGARQKDAADILGVSVRTMGRLSSGESEIDQNIQRLTVEHTGVPSWFMEHGFNPPPASEDPDLAERTSALEDKVETLYRVLVSRSAADVAAARDRPGEGGARSDGS